MSLSLGPSFTDTDIKRTLDNCRLDYVYEPDWTRLYARISRMLSQGKVVAWFQGAMAFGPRSMGSRSILCDPSGRYARNNMNEYLRQTPLDEPLPLVFAPSAVAACLASPAASAFSALDTVVDPKCRESLAAALDSQHRARVHTVTAAQAPQLCDLLEAHLKNTAVPALIETNLGEPGPTACTPRDAIRTVYSSAIDALVMGRFFLMKDHWLLRSNAG
jgi:carbamoyltransferase